MRKIILVYMLCMSSIVGVELFAGELSNFEIIGFNNLWSKFAFAEYGVDSNVRPYANIFIVDIPRNDFLPLGVFRGKYLPSDSVEADGRSALYSELLNASVSLKNYGIDPQNTANLIYILLDSEDVGDSFDFVDYNTNYSYFVNLNQTTREDGENSEAAFDISVQIQKQNGSTITRTVGSRNYFRQGVLKYTIRSIYATPDDRSLIFVVEKTVYNSSGDNGIYYMIESLTWQ